MGTSTGFPMSGGPQWGDAKSDARDAAGSPGVDPKIRQALRSHLAACAAEDRTGASSSRSRGAGGGAGGGGGGGTRAARTVASGLGGFIHDTQAHGLRQALTNRGLEHLVNQTLSEVVQGILSSLGESAAFVEESDALTAAGAVLDELQADCEDVDEFEEKLNELVDSEKLSQLFEEFFRRALIEDFMRRHWTQLQEKHANSQIDAFRARVEELLLERVKYEHDWKDLTTVDWSSPESEALIEQIQQETLEICLEVDL